MGVGGQRHSPAALPPGNTGTHCTGDCVGPRAGLDGCEKSRPHRDSIPGPSSRSESLYRLSYPGPLTSGYIINYLYKDYSNTRIQFGLTHSRVQLKRDGTR